MPPRRLRGVVELGRLNFESLVRHSYYVCKHNLKPLEGGLSLSLRLRVVRKKGKIWIEISDSDSNVWP